MNGFWFDMLGLAAVIAVVFVLVLACEADRHTKNERRNRFMP